MHLSEVGPRLGEFFRRILENPPPSDALAHVSGQQDEQIRLGEREIFVNYGGGMGRSKLRIPAAKTGTARNMNTVAKLVGIASKPWSVKRGMIGRQ